MLNRATHVMHHIAEEAVSKFAIKVKVTIDKLNHVTSASHGTRLSNFLHLSTKLNFGHTSHWRVYITGSQHHIQFYWSPYPNTSDPIC